MRKWLDSPDHASWLRAETTRLLDFGRSSGIPGQGAGWLDSYGIVEPDRAPATWITCRMVHVYALGHLLGIPGCRTVATQALSGLTGALRDREFGGWFNDATGDSPAGKQAYDHAFVVLAASSATAAGFMGADRLLEDALDVVGTHFLDPDGMVVDSWNRDFTAAANYRGINSTMHTVEALLAAADITQDRRWLRSAASLARFAAEKAGANQWRMPEHFTPEWEPLPQYNEDRPNDQFRPYGATVGHGLEWARLLLHTEASLQAAEIEDCPAPAVGWLVAAQALYDRAVTDGWEADGKPGFIYTTGWDGTPITRDRLHWVTAEAIAAAAALYRRTSEDHYARDYTTWWEFAATYFIDRQRGSWHHELDPSNRVAASVWPGKPDLYHAVQATLIPTLPLAPSLAAALARA